MNIPAPIIGILAANSAANALLGGRVYPLLAPQGTAFPCVVVNTSGVTPENTKNGPALLDNVRVQVDAYAPTYAAANDTAEAVRVAMDYYRGMVSYQSVLYPVDSMFYVSQTDMMETEREVYRVMCEYKMRIPRLAETTLPIPPIDITSIFYDDAAALAAGLQPGDWYLLAWGNGYGMAGYMPKKVE